MPYKQVLIGLILLSATFLFPNKCFAQAEVKVTSWCKGDIELIKESFEVRLTAGQKEYARSLFDVSGKEYELRFIFMPSVENDFSESGRSTEAWAFELLRVHRREGNEAVYGQNLLQKEPKAEEGDYGDSFTNVGLPLTFYPKRETRITMNGKPFIDGRLHYPVETKRVFELRRSTLTFMATDLQLNLRDRHVLDYIVITVEISTHQVDLK